MTRGTVELVLRSTWEVTRSDYGATAAWITVAERFGRELGMEGWELYLWIKELERTAEYLCHGPAVVSSGDVESIAGPGVAPDILPEARSDPSAQEARPAEVGQVGWYAHWVALACNPQSDADVILDKGGDAR